RRYPTLMARTQRLPMDKCHEAGHVPCSASALPAWIARAFPLLFPLLILQLLLAFLRIPLLAIGAFFLIHLFFVIDAWLVRCPVIGSVVAVYPGGWGLMPYGVDRTSGEHCQHSQTEDNPDWASSHR